MNREAKRIAREERERCALIQSLDAQKRAAQALAAERRTYNSRPFTKKDAHKAAKSYRANVNDRFRSGERVFIEVGTAVGRENRDGSISSIRSLEIQTGRTLMRKRELGLVSLRPGELWERSQLGASRVSFRELYGR